MPAVLRHPDHLPHFDLLHIERKSMSGARLRVVELERELRAGPQELLERQVGVAIFDDRGPGGTRPAVPGRRYPGAWYVAGWAAGEAWYATTWDSLGNWMNYYGASPVYYDYGNNVTYQDNNVYVNGQDVGTSQQYYDQAATLASTGTQAAAPADGDWLPLGVFALCKTGETSSDLTMQLAVNPDGIVRGNYTDAATNTTQQIHGSVDKKTQRVAFTVGDNKTNVIETGLYN
jgi:hypothetical protein